MRTFIIVLSILLISACALGDTPSTDLAVGLTEQLGARVDLGLEFTNEHGDTVTLSELVTKPTILNLVYYECPGICTPLLSGLQDVLDRVNLVPGVDFDVVTISIRHEEGPALAAEKKQNYMQRFERGFPPESWHWLTGDSVNIQQICQTVGFGFQRAGDDFAHPASLIVLAKDGMIARYLTGTKFNHFNLQLAVNEASDGRTGPTIAKLLEFCFSYDPEGREYVFNFKRLAGGVVLLFSVIFFVTIIVNSQRKKG